MPDWNERRTDRANKAIVQSETEAEKRGHHYIGTEHILLALLTDKDSLAGRILRDLGVTYQAVSDQFDELIQPSKEPNA